LRRSYQKKGSKEPIHMVSAFAARQRLVMGQGCSILYTESAMQQCLTI